MVTCDWAWCLPALGVGVGAAEASWEGDSTGRLGAWASPQLLCPLNLETAPSSGKPHQPSDGLSGHEELVLRVAASPGRRTAHGQDPAGKLVPVFRGLMSEPLLGRSWPEKGPRKGMLQGGSLWPGREELSNVCLKIDQPAHQEMGPPSREGAGSRICDPAPCGLSPAGVPEVWAQGGEKAGLGRHPSGPADVASAPRRGQGTSSPAWECWGGRHSSPMTPWLGHPPPPASASLSVPSGSG